MKFYSVFDPEFKPYGQVVKGLDETVSEILTALATTPCTDHVEYVPYDDCLQNLPAKDDHFTLTREMIRIFDEGKEPK